MKALGRFILIFSFGLLNCVRPNSYGGKNTLHYGGFSTRLDSLFVSRYFRGLSEKNWYTFKDYSLQYYISNEDIELSYPGVFYDKPKTKLIVWVCEKMLNAESIKRYNENDAFNKICPTGKDTVYHMSALIGFRDSIDLVWKLYPMLNKQAVCYSSREAAIKEMVNYYFDEMKYDKVWVVVQGGKEKGKFEFVSYGYNIQDPDFWEESVLWKRDTVGSFGLYPFQIKGYGYGATETCIKCADTLEIPSIKANGW